MISVVSQVWILEPSGDGDSVVLRSHLNRFIAVDQFGNVTCDQVRVPVLLVRMSYLSVGSREKNEQ